MTNDEYKEFLKYIFDEYIQPRIHRIERYLDHPKHYHWHYEWRCLKRAVALINYIDNHCDDQNDIYRTFTLERLRRAVDEVKDGVRWNNRLAEEAGFLDAFDSHYNEIIQGLDIELFPESELEILHEFGARDPKSKLRGMIYLLKTRNKDECSYNNEMSISNQLNKIVKRLDEAESAFKETDKNSTENKDRPKKSRRWFKGLGQIGQGAALSIGDIALAAGMLEFPASPETQTWGALVSATTGVGMILNGVGELRGE